MKILIGFNVWEIIMKVCLLVFCFTLMVSSLFCFESPLFKVAAQTDLLQQGATLGVRVSNEQNLTRQLYVVAGAKAPFIDEGEKGFLVSLFAEKHFIYNDNSYGKYCLGVEYVEFEDWSFDSDDLNRIFLPKLAIGVGYQIKIDEGIYLFSDLDFGIQYYMANINLGMKF